MHNETLLVKCLAIYCEVHRKVMVSESHTHTRTHARTHARTHTHTYLYSQNITDVIYTYTYTCVFVPCA